MKKTTVVFVVDNSLSMGLPIQGGPVITKHKIVARFLDELFASLPKSFDPIIVVAAKESYRAGIKHFRWEKPHGTAHVSEGLRVALEFRPDRIVLISDGDMAAPDGEDEALRVVEDLAHRGVRLDVLSILDEKANDRILGRLAEIGRGAYMRICRNADVKGVIVKQCLALTDGKEEP